MLSLEKHWVTEQFWLEKTFKMTKSNSGMINNIMLLLVFSVSCKTMHAAASQMWMGLRNITRIDIKLKFMPYFNSPHISTLFTRLSLDKIHTEKAVTVNHLSWSLLVLSPKCLIFLKNKLLIYISVNSLFQGLFKCYLCYWDAPALILL